jgi:membrane-bound lytic murein transglycosylase B
MILFTERAATVAPAPRARRAVAILAAKARAVRGRLLFSLAMLTVTALDAAGTEGVAPLSYDKRPETRAFIAELVAEHGSRAATSRLFAQALPAANRRGDVAPILAAEWYEYAPQFLSRERIDGGLGSGGPMRQHARAQVEFGSPVEVIFAIIGVETFYGRNPGSYRVFDALTTLAFDYPRRSDFFRNELRQFLLLARDQGISPLVPKGSYAGASGLPQFMPGSIRAYALDYDGDGRIDLSAEPADAIGSVANYLARHDWQPGAPVLAQARVDPAASERLRKLDGGSASGGHDAWARDGVDADACRPTRVPTRRLVDAGGS